MKKKNLISILLSILFFAVPLHLVMAQELRPKFKSKVVVVQFEEDIAIGEGAAKTNLAKFDHTGSKYGVYRIERVFPFLDYVEPTPRTAKNLSALRRTYYIRYGAQADPEQVSEELSLSSGVVYAEPVPVNRIHRSVVRADPNDTKYQEQTYLKHMRFPEAWDIIKSEDASDPIIIAIIDDGADWRHEDLLTNVWTNEDEIAGNGIDDDRNGFIDDIHGINLGNGDATNNDPSAPSVGNDHGTPVASVAGAVTDNAAGIAGAAWNAKLMHINTLCQVKEAGEVGEICGGYEGIVYAAVNGADVINTSWGFPTEDKELRMINQSLDFVTDSGALVVASAGNENINADTGLGYPQAHPRVLSVGATKKDSRERADFSTYGKTVGVFAPGVDIIAAAPDNKYNLETGTSFSAPLVAGVAALIKARFSEISPDSLREQLRLSSESMDAENPSYAGYLGRGYVNAEASLQPPKFPAVRVKRWSWKDDDGDHQIDPGDEVTINVTMVNYLVDAQQLMLELIEAKDYPHIMIGEAEQSVGLLRGGDSTEVTFRFTVSEDVPANRKAMFYVRIRDGAFTDVADALQFFGINRRMALLHTAFKALYLSTDGDNWTNKSGWDVNTVPTIEQMADWHGVLAFRGQVDGLDLRFNNLVGSLPPELGQASGLSSLTLSENFITGSIPPELGQLSDLEHLDLRANSLSGSIPPELAQLLNLGRLDLENNSLSGVIPSALGQLSNLETLNLAGNSLAGSIPSELAQLSNLETLDLGGNSLSETIPMALGQLSNLQELDLWNNSLTGLIPPSLGQLSDMEQLDLGSNSLSGPVPPELGQLSELTLLNLSQNSLTGRLPRSLLQLKKLLSLNFSGQELCAPEDEEFQAWLKGVSLVLGPTCGVSTAISKEDGSLPETFAILGNYPNPFQQTTRLMFDLPRESRIRVEVTDMIGRQVLTVPDHTVAAGWGKSVELSGRSLPAGFYLYRLIADSPSERSVQVGRFVRIR